MKLDYQRLRTAADFEKFQQFEVEVLGAVDQEVRDRKRRILEARRTRERKARKKRLKMLSRLRQN